MSLQNRLFCIRVYLHSSKAPTSFKLNVNDELKIIGMSMEESNVLFNYTSFKTQSTKSGVPWRGPHEKDPAFFQMVIKALTKPGHLVLDPFASIGKFFLFKSFGLPF